MSLTDADNGRYRDLQVVAIDDLHVDHAYQRELNQNLVEEILRDWDMVAADAITVSKRSNGRLFIVNGQHRAAAAKLAGETELLAFVYEGLTRAKEADLRLKANNRRGDTSLERFHAQLTAGRRESRAIVALLDEFGTSINRVSSIHKGVNCVSAVEKMYREDPEMLRRTLRLVTEAFGVVAGVQATDAVLRGTFWFLKVHDGDYHLPSLRERLHTQGPEDLLRKARSHHAVAGGAGWLNYYRAVVEAYNHRRMEHTRLEVRTKYAHRQEVPS